MISKSADAELIRRVQGGDNRAFDVLVVKYQQAILNLLGRYIQDSHEVFDIAQEVFIKAYRSLAQFRGESAFYTWLYRIAVNTAKSHLLNRSRQPKNDISLDEHEIYPHQLRDIANPENQLITEQLEQLIYKTIRELPEELRIAITLREFDGLSYEEIAAVMDCPVGTVRSRIFRAREAIDQQINH